MSYDIRFVPIPFDLAAWKYTSQELAEKYICQDILEDYKAIGVSRVYWVSFDRDEDEEGYELDEDEIGSYSTVHRDYFIQDPSYDTVVEYIREHSDSEVEAQIHIADIKDKLAVVLERKGDA